MMPWIILLLVFSPAIAADMPEVVLRQATLSDGVPLPRPMVGTAAPGVTGVSFHLALSYRCPADTEHQQLFVSIADTTRLEDVSKTPSPDIVRMDVPLRQLQWLMQPDAECLAVGDKRPPDETDGSGVRYYSLGAGTAGYAMLTCTGKDRKATAATTFVPLTVWLSCPAAEGTEPGDP